MSAVKINWNISWRYKTDNPIWKNNDKYELPFETKKQVRKWWTENHNKSYSKKFINATILKPKTK
jgi:hypothetical protein